MIKSFNTYHQAINPPTSSIPLNEGARKVFEEASGVGDLFVPEVEDRYEDMAADFLEKWIVSSNEPSGGDSKANTNTLSVVQEKRPAAEFAPKPATEPTLTNFSIGLDWQLSDGRTI